MSQDYTKSFYWNEKAAEQGDGEATYNIAMMYYNGLGVSKNRIKARHYLKQACKDFVDDACVQYKKMAH